MKSCDIETPGPPQSVKSAKPTINTTPPKTYSHLTIKLKNQKAALEEELAMTIQRNNNMLVEKISHIMRTSGGVDNRNYYDSKRSVEVVVELSM
ncbi:uncharacterized protein CFAP97D2 [Anarhichas minor]|uniref:uncharacterized protein CFAP97D2 n=1 Tax=Anarhichas minor TaxID=65739 RepID=UPI003F73F2F5